MADSLSFLNPSDPMGVAAPPEATPAEVAAPAAPVPVVSVFDHNSKQVLEIPETDLEMALSSGQYTLPKNTEVFMVAPGGEVGLVSSADAFKALHSGYRLETPEETHEREVQAKYGDREGEAALQGAARGLSFGLSDVLQTATGFRSPEELAGMQEANPAASGFGEVGGVVGGLLLPVGPAGAAVKGASKAAQATERVVAKELSKLGVKNTVAKALVQKIIPTAAGSAVEGAMYGGGQFISEASLGKADFNAENLVGFVGTGALIGGSAGGLLSAAGVAMAPLADKVKPAVRSLAQKAEKTFLDKETAATQLAGYSPSQAARLGDRNPTLVKELPEFFRSVGMKAHDSFDDLVGKVTGAKRTAGETIETVMKELDNSGLAIDREWAEVAANKVREMTGKYRDIPGYSEAVKRLDKFADDVNKLVIKQKTWKASELNTVRKLQDELINYGKSVQEMPLIQEAAYIVRTSARGEIDKLANTLSPETAALLKQANRDYHIASEILPKMEAKAEHVGFGGLKDAVLGGVAVSGGLPGLAVAAAGKFAQSDLRRRLVVLSNIEKAQQAVYGAMKKSVDEFFKPASKAVKPLVTQSLLKSELSYNIRELKPKAPKTRQVAYQNISENLQQLAGNLERVMERTNRITSSMYNDAPETSAMVDTVVSNGVAFLASKLPRQTGGTGVLGVLQQRRMPADYEIAKFERYLGAVERPQSVLEDLQRGTLTAEGVEALKTVYPALYGQVREQVMERLAVDGDKLSYQKRLMLGTLLDIPSDESLLPQNVLGLQANFAASAQPPQPSPGAANFTKSDKLASSSEKDSTLD